jgi:membrane protein
LKIKQQFQSLFWWLRQDWVRNTIRWSQSTSFIGFHGIPVYDILLFLNRERKRDDIVMRTNAISFNLFLALFPALIFIVAIFSTISVITFEDFVNQLGDNILPETARDFLFKTFADLANNPRGSLLSVGVLLALIFSSNGMMSLIDGFEKSYSSTFIHRPYWKKRLIALQLTFLLILLLLVSSSLIITSNLILSWLFKNIELDVISQFVFITFKWLFAFSLFYTLIAILYKFGPALKRRFNFFSPGTNLAAIGSFLTSLGFSFFVNNFGTYNKIYGSIGAIIVMMIYIQLNVFILLAGFELNTAIAVNRDIKGSSQSNEEMDKINQMSDE